MHTTLPASATDLADAIRAGTSGTDHTYTAAVDILLGLPHQLHARDDIRASIHTADDGTAWVDWSQLGYRLRRHEIPLSSGERRMLALACSLGSTDVEVSLAQVLVGVDLANAALVMAALRTAAGLSVDPLAYDRADTEPAPMPVPAGVETYPLTGRRCRRCRATTGLPLAEWECADGCHAQIETEVA